MGSRGNVIQCRKWRQKKILRRENILESVVQFDDLSTTESGGVANLLNHFISQGGGMSTPHSRKMGYVQAFGSIV